MDIEDSLHTYEVEYEVFQDDMQTSKSDSIDGSIDLEDDLYRVVTNLRDQNYQLTEKLQAANNKLHSQVSMDSLLSLLSSSSSSVSSSSTHESQLISFRY